MQIRFDTAPDAQKHWFSDPVYTIRAQSAGHVDDALRQIDDARAQGYWIAGYADYELGYALEPRLAHRMPDTQSGRDLLNFGAFSGPIERHDPTVSPCSISDWTPHWTENQYIQAFDRVIEWIKAGDVYQINLTFPMMAQITGDAWSLYHALTSRQRVKHGAFVDLGADQGAFLSRSPELFFRTDAQGHIETRPMKGTQPRHTDPNRDEQARRFLETDEKNRAENLMIVDLLRNDISRICRTGSVHVPKLFHVETYATVHQMVSLVAGELDGPVQFSQIMRALFPCGSITGAPKLRAMEIIDDLEPAPRGIYCGTIGWMAPDGKSEFNVAIRTLDVKNGQARLNVGGGVVYDSLGPSEYEEALWKARFAKLSPPIAA